MNTKERIEALIKRLNTIAKRNHDQFRYEMRFNGWPIRYVFQAVETADNHEFVGGSGTTIDDAIIEADNAIAGALDAWSYKE